MEVELARDYKELLELLSNHGVRYLLIGGYAVGLHGHVRSTYDLDIAVASDHENAERVFAALSEFGFSQGFSKDSFTTPNSLVVMGVEPNAVDIINYLKGVDFEDAYARRELRPAEDIVLSLISLRDLIANKTAVGRDKDKLDVKELLRVNNET